MYELIATYGDTATNWLLVAISAILARYIYVLIESTVTRRYVSALWDEVRAAVLEVEQTYVAALRRGREDGLLTDDEKAEARKLAIETAKSNFGLKGLKRLAKIFDVDKWIGTKLEATVAAVKLAKAPALPVAVALPQSRQHPQSSPGQSEDAR